MAKLLLRTLLAVLASSTCAGSGYLVGIGRARHCQRVPHEHWNYRVACHSGRKARHQHGLVLCMVYLLKPTSHVNGTNIN